LVISIDAMGGDHGPPVVIPAVVRAISLLPSFAFLITLQTNSVLGALGATVQQVHGEVGETLRTLNLLGNGFIITAILWGAATAEMIDRRFRASALYLVIGAVFCLFGVIHSPGAQGTFSVPWKLTSPIPWHFAAAYLLSALLIAAWKFLPAERDEIPDAVLDESSA